jgi:hypothetical protein
VVTDFCLTIFCATAGDWQEGHSPKPMKYRDNQQTVFAIYKIRIPFWGVADDFMFG